MARPLRTALTLWTTLERLWPGKATIGSDRNFGRVWGTLKIKTLIREGRSVSEIEGSWEAELEALG